VSLHDYLTDRERQALDDSRQWDVVIARLRGEYVDPGSMYTPESQRTLTADRESALQRNDWTWIREIDAKLARINAQIADYEGRKALFLSQVPSDEELARRQAAEELRQREEQAQREAKRQAAEVAAQPIMALYSEFASLLAAITTKALEIDEAQTRHRDEYYPVVINPPGSTIRRLVYVGTALEELAGGIRQKTIEGLKEWPDAQTVSVEAASEETVTS